MDQLIHYIRSTLRRIFALINPTVVSKNDNALRIGLLGASKIAPLAVIHPAKTHPDVIIAAIAARDATKAQTYAKKYGIPIVHTSYQDLIDDPALDAIYIPLPNGLHYEWAVKSLKAGKHVLLEKPSTSNSAEATSLFHHPLLQQPNAPILLEAFHPLFHPSFQTFLSHINPQNVVSARSSAKIPKGLLSHTDIRFIFDLAGGTLMDLGCYNILCLRSIFGAEASECVGAESRLMPASYDQKCDQAMTAKWKFPTGGTGEISCDWAGRGTGWLAWMPWLELPLCEAVHGEIIVKHHSDEMEETQGNLEHVVVKIVKFWNFLGPYLWHRIDISEVHSMRNVSDKAIKKSWTEKKSIKAYTWPRLTKHWGTDKEGWTTYRYMLEEFVNRVRGNPGSGIWMTGEESITQMRMIDEAYGRAGMDVRPTSKFL